MKTRGIILAAGASQRMGKPKALLTAGGETFLHRVIGAFRGGGVEEILVVIAEPHAEALRRVLAGEENAPRCLINPDPSQGPISSLRLAIGVEPEREAYLVHPVDIPAIEEGDVRDLRAALRSHPKVDAVLPSVKKRRAHPVLLTRKLARRVLDLAPEKTLRDLLRDEGTSLVFVEMENELLLLDVDTPEDYAKLQARI